MLLGADRLLRPQQGGERLALVLDPGVEGGEQLGAGDELVLQRQDAE